MTFAQKVLSVTVQQDASPYSVGQPKPPIKLTGLRMMAQVSIVGMPGKNHADITIYGMTPGDMAQFSRAGLTPLRQRNDVLSLNAYEINPDTGLPTAEGLVYAGVIAYAYQDFSASPDTCMKFDCFEGQFTGTLPASPNSFPPPAAGQGTDIVQVMTQLAAAANLKLENNGVQAQLATPYFWGPIRQQIQYAADSANIYAFIENETTLVICPKDSNRGGSIPVIDASSGMVLYPLATIQGGYTLRTLYNPALRFLGQVQIKSSIPQLSGTFKIRRLSHDLSSNVPNGPWFSDFDAVIPALAYL